MKDERKRSCSRYSVKSVRHEMMIDSRGGTTGLDGVLIVGKMQSSVIMCLSSPSLKVYIIKD
jgi:hypothetical protein